MLTSKSVKPPGSTGYLGPDKCPAEPRPDLALVTFIAGGPWTTLKPDHALYPVFHWAWSYQAEWSPSAHEAFWTANLGLWPRHPGSPKADLRARAIADLRSYGIPDAVIAAGLSCVKDSLRKQGIFRMAEDYQQEREDHIRERWEAATAGRRSAPPPPPAPFIWPLLTPRRDDDLDLGGDLGCPQPRMPTIGRESKIAWIQLEKKSVAVQETENRLWNQARPCLLPREDGVLPGSRSPHLRTAGGVRSPAEAHETAERPAMTEAEFRAFAAKLHQTAPTKDPTVGPRRPQMTSLDLPLD